MSKICQTTLPHYFSSRLRSGNSLLRLHLPDDTIDYLTAFLVRQALSPSIDLKSPMGVMFLQAMLEGNNQPKMQQVGETVLFVSGHFPEFLTKQAYSRQYYWGLGQGAFANLGKEHAAVALHFTACIDAIMYTSESLLSASPLTLHELASNNGGVPPSKEAIRMLHRTSSHEPSSDYSFVSSSKDLLPL